MISWLRRAAIALGSHILGAILRLYVLTLRVERQGAVRLRTTLANGPVIYAFFHNRILLMPFSIPFGTPYRPAYVMISPSDDGTLISRAVERLGVVPIRGSSSRGGREARHQQLKLLRQGANIGITPDGPRGPALTVKPGVIWLARESGCPIVPICWGANRVRRLHSWDHFLVPMPGARVYMHLGDPLYLNTETDFDTDQRRVESVMKQQLHMVDPEDPTGQENRE